MVEMMEQILIKRSENDLIKANIDCHKDKLVWVWHNSYVSSFPPFGSI